MILSLKHICNLVHSQTGGSYLPARIFGGLGVFSSS